MIVSTCAWRLSSMAGTDFGQEFECDYIGSSTSLFPFRITVASERPIIALYSIAHF